MFNKTFSVLGKYQSKKLIDWKTSRIVGSKSFSRYLLTYEVTYEKFKAKEILSLLKENEETKIVGYNIVSEGFVK